MLNRLAVSISLLLSCGTLVAAEWQLPPDKGTLEPEAISTILAGNDYPETSGYRRKTEYIDFSAYGQNFTQVVVTLTPDKPRKHKGRKLVVVGGEPGSEYAMDFLETPEGKEGPGIWLAKRGVTFIGLTRVGRWNFFDKSGNGSWKDIPLEVRMPIFNRQQSAPWSAADFDVKTNNGQAPTSGDSNLYRLPKDGSALYNQMLATTAHTYLSGYQKAIEHALPPAQRKKSFMLYWGMSTGGAFLYPLAKYLPPDGYLGWGTSSTGLAYAYRKASQNDYKSAYAKTAMRLRERGLDDFGYYTKELDANTREQWWQGVLKSPRFKSGEDAPMQLGAAALTENALRLWQAEWLPAQYRQRGLAALVNEVMEPSFPPVALKKLAVLDMNGLKDEAIPPKVVDAHRVVMEPYVGKYRVARVSGFQHYLYKQDSIKVVGSLWLRFIESGYFDAK
ncbi:MAG: hypothetical protein Q8R69_17835 [Telluria sp.]|nr:hypothetical protein [Telluria sp.]